MNHLTATVLLAYHADVPLKPDREQGQQWAREVLRETPTATPDVSVVPSTYPSVDATNLPQVPNQPPQAPAKAPEPIAINLPSGLLWILLALLVVLLLVWLFWAWRAGKLPHPRRKKKPQATVIDGAPVFDDEFGALSVAEHRSAADQAADAGNWNVAVIERFRAMVRYVEDHRLIVRSPGFTSQEVVRQASTALPVTQSALAPAALRFEETLYGRRQATAAHNDQLRALEQHLTDQINGFQSGGPIRNGSRVVAGTAGPTELS